MHTDITMSMVTDITTDTGMRTPCRPSTAS